MRALLAKADATSFEEEAETFLAKAQELMAHHSLQADAPTTGAPCQAAERHYMQCCPCYLAAFAGALAFVAAAEALRWSATTELKSWR